MNNLTWLIGNVRITRIVEGETSLPLTDTLPDATPEAIAPYKNWLAPHFMNDEGHFTLSFHAFVVESAGKHIVIDTCVGEHLVSFLDFLDAAPRSFLENLASAGFSRESVDIVLCTHLHVDHVGWNTMREGDCWVPTFPNARYLFVREELQHWNAEAERSLVGTFEQTVEPILQAGLADLVETNHKITDEVWLEPTPGHTPGHVAVRIKSHGKLAMVTGDLTHHPVQWTEPNWSVSAADTDHVRAAETRRRLLREHVDTPLLIIGMHYPAPCVGHLVSDRGRVRFDTEL